VSAALINAQRSPERLPEQQGALPGFTFSLDMVLQADLTNHQPAEDR
jgi:hypothetical protein